MQGAGRGAAVAIIVVVPLVVVGAGWFFIRPRGSKWTAPQGKELTRQRRQAAFGTIVFALFVVGVVAVAHAIT